jgi:hypothetical protein
VRRAPGYGLAAVLVLFLSAPRGAQPALGPRYGGEIRLALADLPATGAPALPRNLAERVLAGLVHETLIGVDDEGRPRPALAQSWSSAADGREWTLRLAPATFHDGSALTAADAVRAVERFLRSGTSAGTHLARSLEGGAAGVRAPDESRLVLRFREPTALPLAALASPAAAVVSTRGAGAGPFAPTTPPSPRGLSATAFGRHVRGRPFLDVVRLVPATGDRARADGDVTVSGGPLPPAAGLLLLVLDPAAPPLSNAGTRALIASAVDRPALARHFLPGGEPADTLLPAILLPPLPVDPSAPRRATAAPLHGRLTLRVGSEVPPPASQRVVAHLAALGLEVDAVPASAATIATGAQARLVVWYPEVAEAALALEELAALAAAPSDLRAALSASEAIRDADRRRAELQRIEEALRARHVLLPLARLPLGLGGRTGVHGLRATASGVLVLEDAWVEP